MSAVKRQLKSASLVERIADAVLYEGYILYPYRPSAVKNQQRWNFGVLCPESYAVAQRGTESWTMQTECLLEADASTTVSIKLRFLHLMLRETRDGSSLPKVWQEAVTREVVIPQIRVHELNSPQFVKFDFPASRTTESLADANGEIVRTQQSLAGEIQIVVADAVSPRDTPRETGRQLVKLSVVVRNLTNFDDANNRSRDEALMYSFVSTHTILEAQQGAFVSLLDPPDIYKTAASVCANTGTYPVLVGDEGEHSCMLSSPIILYDYPQIASESAGELFDGTEIDEILTLRIMSLTNDEKSEMRQSDVLARQLLERTESLSAEQLMNLHGVMKKA